MRRSWATCLFILAITSFVSAQTGPSGHWEGSIQAPEKEVKIEVDLGRNAKGELIGAFSNPTFGERNFPLSNVVANGSAVSFEIKASAGGGVFKGVVAADGKSMEGNFVMEHMEIPFALHRTGEPRFETVPPIPRVTKELEGIWIGTLQAGEAQKQIGLTVINQPDGTASAKVVSSEGVEIPITAISQKGSSVSLDIKNIGGTYAGTLNAAGTELTDTWTQGKFVGALTFRRGPAK
jgi:hypothetical protein